MNINILFYDIKCWWIYFILYGSIPLAMYFVSRNGILIIWKNKPIRLRKDIVSTIWYIFLCIWYNFKFLILYLTKYPLAYIIICKKYGFVTIILKWHILPQVENLLKYFFFFSLNRATSTPLLIRFVIYIFFSANIFMSLLSLRSYFKLHVTYE